MAKHSTDSDALENSLTIILVGIFAVVVLAFLALVFGAILFAPIKAA